MRGKEERERASKLAGGITPAYAGKRTKYEHVKKCPEGSPPPMRGKVEIPAVLI